MDVKILYLAEIVGKSGIWAVKNILPKLKKELNPDLIIANGDGTTGGWGLGRQHAGYLRKLGINVITGGDCIFYKKDLTENLNKLPYVLRPVNLSAESPGRGWRLFTTETNKKIAVVSIMGRALFNRVHTENPFTTIKILAEQIKQETNFIIVDFHAEATAEKQAFFYYADGMVSAIIGSNTRVQTADEKILSKGTGIITDAGRTGSQDSVSGIDPKTKILEYISCIPNWSKEAWDNTVLQAVYLELDSNGKTKKIQRINKPSPQLKTEGK